MERMWSRKDGKGKVPVFVNDPEEEVCAKKNKGMPTASTAFICDICHKIIKKGDVYWKHYTDRWRKKCLSCRQRVIDSL